MLNDSRRVHTVTTTVIVEDMRTCVGGRTATGMFYNNSRSTCHFAWLTLGSGCAESVDTRGNDWMQVVWKECLGRRWWRSRINAIVLRLGSATIDRIEYWLDRAHQPPSIRPSCMRVRTPTYPLGRRSNSIVIAHYL